MLYRLETDVTGYSRLLLHRDVRTLDLPPRYQLTEAEMSLGVNDIPPILPPKPDAPSVVVLDSGIVSNHPLLGPAVGEAVSYVSGLGPEDQHGHGTAVAGLTLYGDIIGALQAGALEPACWLMSGRITDKNAVSTDQFIENKIATAVDYFAGTYRSRLFVLSFGDDRKPYRDGHVNGLAAVLDSLARSRGVLFFVSAGNYSGNDVGMAAPLWKSDYPTYLLDRPTARLLDPAPALNVLTIGSLARFEVPRGAQRYPTDPTFQPVARKEQPSPFSCTGPGPGRAMKPELTHFGGNYAVDLRDATQKSLQNALLGEPAPAHDFATSGKLLRDRVGTSFATPHVAHLAAKLLSQYPKASSNLLRALIVAHAQVPAPARELNVDAEALQRMVGYGLPRTDPTVSSSARCVSMIAEEILGEDQHHYYALPLPADFVTPGRRDRAITIAIAHTPLVRTTRFDYRGSRLSFRLVAARNLASVTRVFQRTPKDQRAEMLPEFRKPNVGCATRDRGTVQAATYRVAQLSKADREEQLFVVVTRTVPAWASAKVPFEPYAVVVALEDRSEVQVQYYAQIREIQERQRGRVRP